MSHEKKRGNREVKKPKQVKAVAAPDALFDKGLTIGTPPPKKKKG